MRHFIPQVFMYTVTGLKVILDFPSDPLHPIYNLETGQLPSASVYYPKQLTLFQAYNAFIGLLLTNTESFRTYHLYLLYSYQTHV